MRRLIQTFGILGLLGLAVGLWNNTSRLPALSIMPTGEPKFFPESSGSMTVVLHVAVTNNTRSTLFCNVAATTEPITNVWDFASHHLGFQLGPKSGTIVDIDYGTGSQPLFLASTYRRVVTSPTEGKVWRLLEKFDMRPKHRGLGRLLRKSSVEPFKPRVGPFSQIVAPATSPSQPTDAVNPAITSQLHSGYHWRGVTDPGR